MASTSAYLEVIGKHEVMNLRTKKYQSIESLWADDKDVVILFVRWFGCILSRYAAVKLGQIKEVLEESGVRVVVIGHSERFHEDYQQYWTGDLYLDQEKNCYKALGLKWYSNFGLLLDTVQPVCQDMIDKAEELNISYQTDGDGRQNGGLLVIQKEPEEPPKMVMMHREEYPGHIVPNSRIIESLNMTSSSTSTTTHEVTPMDRSVLARVCCGHSERTVVEAIVGTVREQEQWEVDYLLLNEQ